MIINALNDFVVHHMRDSKPHLSMAFTIDDVNSEQYYMYYSLLIKMKLFFGYANNT